MSTTSGPRSVGQVTKASGGKKNSTGSKASSGDGVFKSKALNPEQQIIASIINDTKKDNDIEAKVEKVMELTKASKDDAIVALHDCDYDLNRAVTKILEGDSDDAGWTTINTKKDKKDKNSSKNASDSKQPNGLAKQSTGQKGVRGKDGFGKPRQSEDRPGKEQNRRGKRDENCNIHDGEQNDDSKPRAPRREGRGPRQENDGQQNNRRLNNIRGRGGRGTRTFSNQQRATQVVSNTAVTATAATGKTTETDDFPNSIDTWSNTTADPNARPAPVPITSMTVGNWSDVVSGTNEDWSEEDYESNLMETKVFVASSKTAGEDILSKKAPVADGSVSSRAIDQNRSKEAGAQILQSLKGSQQPLTQPQIPPQSQQPANKFLNQTYISKQSASESIKSLVGITSQTTGHVPHGVSGISPSQQSQVLSKAQQQPPTRLPQQRRPMRIPESAVEMPSNNAVTSLGVQFGALDVRFGSDPSTSFKAGPNLPFDTTQLKSVVVPLHQTPGQQPMNIPPPSATSSLLSSAPSASFDPQSKGSLAADSLRQSSDIMKNLVASNKPNEPSQIDRTSQKSATAKSVLDSVKGQDVYTSTSDSYKGQSASYAIGGGNVYHGSGASSFHGGQPAPQYNVYPSQNITYSTPSSYSGYSSATTSKPSMKDLDHTSSATSQPSHRQSSYQELVNSTQTTNVLKNSLSAPGKGVSAVSQGTTGNAAANTNIPSNVPQMMSGMYPQYIMPPGPFFPNMVFDPTGLQMPPTGQDTSQFARGGPYNPNVPDSSKFSRVSEGADPPSGPNSTAAGAVVSQPSQFMSLPPGYGYYYMPGMQAGIFPPGGVPFAPVPPASSAYPTGPSAFAKNSTPYGSFHSAYDTTGLPGPPTDYGVKNCGPYGQSTGGQQTGGPGKGMGAATNDIMGGGSNQPTHGKSHGAGPKMNYGSSNQPSYNLAASQGGSYGNSYVVPPQGYPDSNPGTSRPGPGMGQGIKSTNPSNKTYPSNLYSNQQPW